MTDIEIAKAVAERYGFTYEMDHRGIGCIVTQRFAGGKVVSPFDPANDLNDAFAAADAVGLFDKFRGELCKTRGEWTLHYDGGCDEILTARGTTPGRAICAAILALPKETT